MTEVILIDGKAKAAQLRAEVAAAAAVLAAERRVVPGLAVVLVGDNPASHIYVRNKVRQTAEVGMRSFEFRLSAEASEADVLAQVARLNADPEVDGILVQLPLPRQVSADAVIDVIDPGKDVDGFHLLNIGRLATGRAREALVPCTPQGCLMLIKDHLPALAGKRALVVGRSNIVGKPMAMLLLQEHCTVTLAHSRTADLAAEVGRAEIVVAAAGQAELIKGAWIRPGAVVIDVGMNRIDLGGGKTRLTGDVEFETARGRAGAITPVPGGVGPMTIACLLRNTLIAACRRRGLPPPAL